MKKLLFTLLKIILVIGFSLFSYEFLYSGFVIMNGDNNFIYFGFSGFEEFSKDNGKVQFYWNEFEKMELMGVDGGYLFDENNSRVAIKVDSSNQVIKRSLNADDSLNITS